jgi:HEAT repeat protein
LREFLLNHHGQILGAAAEAIALVGDKSAISKLAELLEDCKDRSSKLDSISVLTGGWIFDYVKVRIAKAMLSLGDERGRPILIEALADGDEGERDYAAWALSRMGETDVAPTLFKLLEKLKGKRESILIAKALERLGLADDERVVEAANSVIKRSQGYFVDGGHVQAVSLLGRIGGEKAINGLINACEHSNPRTQIAAVEALGRISNRLVVMPLLQSLGRIASPASQSAAEALAQLDDPVLYEGLLLSLASEYRYVRRKAAQSIAYYSYDGRATQILTSLSVDDPGERVRSEATKALEYLVRKEEWTIGKSNTIYSHRDTP